VQIALDMWHAFRIPFAIILAQAILETSWGKSILIKAANNWFGIKYAHRQGAEDYGEFDCRTWEMIDGQKKEMLAAFQKFPNTHDCFSAHSLLLLRNACVVKAIPQGWQAVAVALGPWTDQDRAFMKRGIQPDHANYSTNGAYPERLGALVRELHLDDQRFVEELAANSGSLTPKPESRDKEHKQ
jgi:flagellum-specific peptidoglycan hydrolase FlgJ